MSGGAWENVMGVMEDSLESNIPSSGRDTTYNSGFTGKTTGTVVNITGVPFPKSKYYDIYKYGISSGDNTRYHLGDATTETKDWNSDYVYFIYSLAPSFIRGGYYNSGSTAGVFAFNITGGHAVNTNSTRAVLR